MVQDGDQIGLIHEKIPLKLLRLNNTTKEGFILLDFPSNLFEVEMLEEFRGGMNAFVHLRIDKDVSSAIQQTKFACEDCGREYFANAVRDPHRRIDIDSFFPKDGHCFDCGSRDIQPVKGVSQDFNDKLLEEEGNLEEIMGFYDKLGLLIDFEVRRGYGDYERLRETVQCNIKH